MNDLDNLDGWPENGWLSNEKMSIDQAISSITEWSAYSMFAESFYGSIEKDYLADFIVLNKNSFHYKIPINIKFFAPNFLSHMLA